VSISPLLDEMIDLSGQIATLEATRLRAMAEYQQLRANEGDLAARSAPEEIALALHIGRPHVDAQLTLARDLLERLPNTLAALESGHIDLAKARALASVTAPLSVEDARTVEARVLPTAGQRVLGQVRASARYFRDRIDPEAAERRRQQANVDRRVSIDRFDNGAAELCASGPGERVYLAWLVLDTAARRLRAAGDERTLDRLRHDLMLDLILGRFDQRIQVQAYLHLPATTLACLSDDPGILAGYGSVTAEACRELANGDAFWRRVFTDPITGTVKDVDRKTYRPPNGLAEYIKVRDVTCVAPGCVKSAHGCQIDHTIAWADAGCTCEANLEPLCFEHHRLKDLCGWQLHQPAPGTFVWISPVGQSYERLPESIFGARLWAAEAARGLRHPGNLF
jgi:Domain of unknown function (DUF222)